MYNRPDMDHRASSTFQYYKRLRLHISIDAALKLCSYAFCRPAIFQI